jgi:hypothetical protein
MWWILICQNSNGQTIFGDAAAQSMVGLSPDAEYLPLTMMIEQDRYCCTLAI